MIYTASQSPSIHPTLQLPPPSTPLLRRTQQLIANLLHLLELNTFRNGRLLFFEDLLDDGEDFEELGFVETDVGLS
jgi:hypothetical protein